MKYPSLMCSSLYIPSQNVKNNIYFLKGAADARDIGKLSRRLYSIEPPDQKSISVYIIFGKSTKAVCLCII